VKLLFATRNRGKLKELASLVAPHGFEVVSLDDLSEMAEVIEDAPTFAGNAEKKARAALAATGLPSLADDSGLEVDALSGAPGVYSARWAGVVGEAKDAANNAKLLASLAEVPDERRGARFRCALAFVDDSGALLTAEGTCEGAIARAPRGVGGFGYDPLFLVAGTGCTMAELSADEKNRVSHRGQALRALVKALARQTGIT
jgi:XTP/dITP diphosphohydrolase